jgi:hypothetical protein
LLWGSKASLRPSPRKFIAKRKRVIAIAGKKSCHGTEDIRSTASLKREPHEALGAEIPRPRN